MPTPDQVRAQMPALAGLDDDQLVDALHQTYYPALLRAAVASAMGIVTPAPPPAPATLGDRAKDAGISLLKGAVDIPEAAVGLADIPTGGAVGKFLANDGGAVGFRPAEAKAFLDNYYSDAQKASFQKVNDARGFVDTAKAIVQNPSTAVQSAIESAPGMLMGAGISRAALAAAPALSAEVAGAIGEGTQAAGQQVEQTREDSPTGDLTAKQVALTAGSGLVDSLLSAGGAKIAHGLGATNAATLLTGAAASSGGRGVLARAGIGAAEEGLQELAQSTQEQVLQNVAEGKAPDDGVSQAGLLGLAAGGMMGAGANVMHGAAGHAPVDAQAPAIPPVDTGTSAAPAVDPDTGEILPGPPAGAAPPVAPVPVAPVAAMAPPVDTTLPAPQTPGDVIRAAAPPVVGPTSRAAAAAIDATAAGVDAGTVALPQAETVVPSVAPEMEQHVLDFANTRTAQLAEAAKGVKEMTIPSADPEGEPTVVPAVDPRHLTPSEQLEQEFLNQHGGDAAAVAHAYGIDGSPDALAAMRATARATARAATTAATPQQLAATTAATPQQLAAVDPMTPAPDDVQTVAGSPFKTQGSARLALGRHPDPASVAVTPVNGGFVLRPVKPAVAPLPSEQPTVRAPDGTQRATFDTAQAANDYLKTARQAQGGRAPAPVAPLQLGDGRWMLATPAEHALVQAHLAQQAAAAAPATPVAAPVPASSPTVIDAASLKAAHTNADGSFDGHAASDAVKAQVGAALAAGQPVSMVIEGKPREIVKQSTLGMVDRNGNSWGMMPLVMPAPGDHARIEIGAKPEAPVEAPKPADWTAYHPSTGTLGVPRAVMPQVAAEHRGALVNFLKARGVQAVAEKVDPMTLKPTQAEFHPDKVQAARNYSGGQRAVLISSDNHVVDGHHQTMAADGPIDAIRLKAPITHLLALVSQFPSATMDETGSAAPKARQGEQHEIQGQNGRRQEEGLKPAAGASIAPAPRMRNGEVESRNGLTPSEQRANTIASTASELAMMVHNESTEADFDPKEIPQAVRNQTWPAGMADAEKHEAVLAAVQARPQFRRKQGVMSELRKAIKESMPAANAESRSYKSIPEPARSAVRAVDDHVDGKIDKAALVERLGAMNLPEGIVRSVTNRLDTFNEHDVAKVMASGAVLEDRSRVGSDAVLNKLAAQGYEKTDAPRVRAAERLNKLLDQRDTMDPDVFMGRLDRLARELAEASTTKSANRIAAGDRERGVDIVREKIIAAMRKGDIDRETGDFAMWALGKNPALAEGLGISVRSPTNTSSAGQYNPANRVISLFKGATNDGTAVHEILHHTERMMPGAIQAGIHAEWAGAIAKAIADAPKDSPRAAALHAIVEAIESPSQKRLEAVHDAFAANGPLDYDRDYQLVNPSEFWAVNATRLMQARYGAQTWQARARQWISEMVQKVRGILGLSSDHPVLKGLQAVLNGDGTELSKRMLSERPNQLAPVDAARRGMLKAAGAAAGLAAGGRAMGIAAPVRTAQLGNIPESKPSQGQVLHDLARPSLEAVRNIALPAGYITNDFMGPVSGKVSLWHKTIGTPYHLAQKYPEFKRVFDGIQTFLNDVSMYASKAADLAPRMLPKLEGWKDLGKSPISVEDTKALSPAIFSDEDWTRGPDGKVAPITEEQRGASKAHDDAVAAVEGRNAARQAQMANFTLEQKRDYLLQHRQVTPEVMRMWEGHEVDQHAKMLDTAFQKAITEAAPVAPDGLAKGTVFSDDELRQHFGLNDQQIGLYREFRGAVDQSLDQMTSAQMLRLVGADASPEVRSQAMAAKTAADAAEVIRAHLAQVAEESPKRAESLASTTQAVQRLAENAERLKAQGYAPRSRFGTYALDVVDKASGERLFFNLYESAADRARDMRHLQASGQFDDATFSQGTTSQEKYKLFSQMSPDTVELFGDMLGLSATGDETGDHAFQEFLRRAKANTSAMKRLMHRSGVQGFSQDAGRVLAGFVYSNARLTSNSLHAGEIQRSVNEIPQGMGQLTDQAMKLMSYVQNPQEDGAKLKGMLFAQYLGGSVASALVNATQPFMTTLPYLSQTGGLVGAGRAMAGALKMAAKGGLTGDAGLDAAMHKYAEAVAPQEVHQMMAQAQGRAALHAGDGTKAGNAAAMAHNAMSKIGLGWGKVFGVAESLNRRLTFIAAYNLATEKGIADPGAFAAKAVAETQFIMNKGNKPVVARGAVGGVLFTFKQYSISYLEMMQRMATAGAPGSPERAAGRRAALYAIGAMMMMAGADGLPFIEDIDDVVDAAMQRLGYNFHSKQARENAIKAMLGTDLGNVVAKGLTGLPGAPLDVSGRLGMANLIPGTGLLIDKVDHSGDLMELAGPAGDLAKRAFTAASQLVNGQPGAAITSIVPKAAANMIQAASMWNSGEYKDQNGKKVIDTDFTDGLSKFIGFQPKDVSDTQGANFNVQQVVAENRLKQTQISDAMAQAIANHDQDALAAARADLASWNAKNPDTPIRIKPGDLRTRVKNMTMDKNQRTLKSTPAGMRESAREQLAAN